MARLHNPFPSIREQSRKGQLQNQIFLYLARYVEGKRRQRFRLIQSLLSPSTARTVLNMRFKKTCSRSLMTLSMLIFYRERCGTRQENMTTHLVSAESAKEIINKQLQLESENRSMAYLIWHYDQKESDRNGWREYIEYPAVAYCKDKEDLRNITEIAVERPPEDTYDFVNREIRTRLIADGKESNGTEGYAIRRTFVGSFTFKQKNQYIDFGKELEAKFRRISTRDAEFQAMSRDEKLAEIVNLIENLLKKDDKYLKLNYSEICEEFLNDDIIKKYKKILQCFRHSAEHSIEERSTFTDDKKDFFIDFGIVIVKTIHKLLEINHQKE